MENVDVIFSAHMVRDDEGACTDAAQLAAERISPHWLWEHLHGLGVSRSRAGQGRVSKTVMPTPQA